MTNLDAYVAAVEHAIKTVDVVFERLDAAETVIPRVPLSQRWAMPPDERDAAERAEIASYNVAPEHWGARLCLMAAWESLQAARRIVASGLPGGEPDDASWRDAEANARESARLAQHAARVFASAACE
jgi:hypothetical protein